MGQRASTPTSDLLIPAQLVVSVTRVAGELQGTTDDWEAVRKWSELVGLETAARAVQVVARSMDPNDRWSAREWGMMISGASGQTGGVG